MSKPTLERMVSAFGWIIIAALVGHFTAGAAAAESLAITSILDKLDTLQTTVNNLETEVSSGLSGIQTTVNGINTKVDEIEAKLDRIQVNVVVDETACATGAVQCSTDGHTVLEAPGPTNHNPVAVGIQVIDKHGNPIDGLGSESFIAHAQFIPAGGPGLSRLFCSQCFLSGTRPGGLPSGMYLIFVHPVLDHNWKSGVYYLEILVSAPTPTGIIKQPALAKISIPF